MTWAKVFEGLDISEMETRVLMLTAPKPMRLKAPTSAGGALMLATAVECLYLEIPLTRKPRAVSHIAEQNKRLIVQRSDEGALPHRAWREAVDQGLGEAFGGPL